MVARYPPSNSIADLKNSALSEEASALAKDVWAAAGTKICTQKNRSAKTIFEGWSTRIRRAPKGMKPCPRPMPI